MKKFLYFVACVGLAGLMSGCASRDYTCNSTSPRRPFCSRAHSWFGGDPCDTCNAPAGQASNCDSNVAPLCDTCGNGDAYGQPVYSGEPVPAVQLYGNPNLNAPMTSPGINQGIENPAPIYSDGAQIQGSGAGVVSDVETPPNF